MKTTTTTAETIRHTKVNVDRKSYFFASVVVDARIVRRGLFVSLGGRKDKKNKNKKSREREKGMKVRKEIYRSKASISSVLPNTSRRWPSLTA